MRGRASGRVTRRGWAPTPRHLHAVSFLLGRYDGSDALRWRRTEGGAEDGGEKKPRSRFIGTHM